ncbi:MAG: methionyl-tRNA formyltransferase, partial [Quisquiliibacterium sp.]
LQARAQPEQGVTYAAKITKSEAALDWRQPADRLADKVRAFDPFPGVQLHLERESAPIKLWRARALGRSAPQALPGTVLQAGNDGLLVACGQAVLSLLELQKPGGRRLALAEFLRGFEIQPGDRFALPAEPAAAVPTR